MSGEGSDFIRGAGWVDGCGQQGVGDDSQVVHQGGIQILLGGGSHCYDGVHH